MSDTAPKKTETPPNKTSRKGLFAVLLILVLGALLLGLLAWVKQDSSSGLTATIRETIGLASPEPAPEPGTPEPETTGTDSLIAFPEAGEAIQESPEQVPDPFPMNQMELAGLAKRPSMWPESLAITIDQAIPVRYRDNNYGEMVFSTDQRIEVIELNRDGRILGSINDNLVSIPAAATNLEAWFVGMHGKYDELIMPEAGAPLETSPRLSDENEQQLLTELRLWTVSNYDTHRIEITPDKLVLHWTPSEDVAIDFRLEAREVARKYLMLGAALGRRDNYASCEIRDEFTGEVLGSNGVFIPSL